MISERVVFQDSLGTKLVGVLSRPYEGYDMPIVIACHGFTSNKDGTTYLKLQEKLGIEGIAIFRYDFRGHGESGGDFSEITYTKGVDGLIRAFKYLKGIGFRKFGLFGTSFGGNVVLNTAIKLGDLITCVACKCPVSDYQKQTTRKKSDMFMNDYKSAGYRLKNFQGKMIKLSYEIYEDAANHNLHIKGKEVKQPVLIVHGNKDEDVLVDQSIKVQQIIPNCDLKIISGVGHKFISKDGINKNSETYNFFIPFFISHLLPNG